MPLLVALLSPCFISEGLSPDSLDEHVDSKLG